MKMAKLRPMHESSTYYEVLEIHPDASPQEIRESYLRLKSAYNKDSPALYSLMGRDETEQTLHEIEAAYLVLSNSERRKEYDQKHGFLEESDPFITATPKHLQKAQRRHHFIPAEAKLPKKSSSAAEDSDDPFSDAADILEVPSTDFTHARMATQQNVPAEASKKLYSPSALPPIVIQTENDSKTSSEVAQETELEDLIHKELEWRGVFIKRIREARRLSIEELADFTKISKKYLKAIEEEDYGKLPAPVYLRGFVIQLAKKLKIPSETVAAAYLARYLQACSNADQ